jgi:hypothetical protein
MLKLNELPEHIKAQIMELSNIMGVKPTDTLCFANSIVAGIDTDNVREAFLEADEDMRSAFTEAYAQHAVKKFTRFTSTLMQDKEANDTFQKMILKQLKGGEL